MSDSIIVGWKWGGGLRMGQVPYVDNFVAIVSIKEDIVMVIFFFFFKTQEACSMVPEFLSTRMCFHINEGPPRNAILNSL